MARNRGRDDRHNDRKLATNAKHFELEQRYRQLVEAQQVLHKAEVAVFRLVQREKQGIMHHLAVMRLSLYRKFPRVARLAHVVDRHQQGIRQIATVGLASLLVGAVAYAFVPQTVTYDFASNQHCITNPMLFPGVFSSGRTADFDLQRPASLQIGRVAIFATKLCADAVQAPQAKTAYRQNQHTGLGPLQLHRTITVQTVSYASIAAISFNTKPLATNVPLQFKLNQVDNTFGYQLVANQKLAPCRATGKLLTCNPQALQLAYATDYDVAVIRIFHGKPLNTIATTKLQTITATTIIKSSIESGATVFDKPRQFTLETDKTLTAIGTVSLVSKDASGQPTTQAVTATFTGKAITINAKEPLARKTNYELHLNDVTANDDSRLQQPYALSFKTSGGPAVSAINVGTTGLTANQAIVVSFDQTLLAGQDPASLVSLTANGAKLGARYSLSGNRITIVPIDAYPVCAHLAVQVSGQAQSQYGISGDSAWSFAARAQCYTTFSIGNSVHGQPIVAYQFGSGPSTVLYVGAMHGDELNAKTVLDKWIAELNAKPDTIPAGRTIVVIPASNPDGVAASTRTNANTVDLNRNFPTNNWQTLVTTPTSHGQPTNQGGSSSLSEPESQALAAFVQARQPRLVLTYHSHAGVVESNESGDSVALGVIYGKSSGYRAVPTSQIGTTFDYSTTGAFEDWLHDKLGLPALVVELRSATADEFNLNRNAMWAMAQVGA